MILLPSLPLPQLFQSPPTSCLLTLFAACLQFPADIRAGKVDGALLPVIEKAAGLMKGQGKQTQGIAVVVGITSALRFDTWFTTGISFRHEDRKCSTARPAPIAFVAALVRHADNTPLNA